MSDADPSEITEVQMSKTRERRREGQRCSLGRAGDIDSFDVRHRTRWASFTLTWRQVHWMACPCQLAIGGRRGVGGCIPSTLFDAREGEKREVGFTSWTVSLVTVWLFSKQMDDLTTGSSTHYRVSCSPPRMHIDKEEQHPGLQERQRPLFSQLHRGRKRQTLEAALSST